MPKKYKDFYGQPHENREAAMKSRTQFQKEWEGFNSMRIIGGMPKLYSFRWPESPQRAFQMAFPNELILSIGGGDYHYCENYGDRTGDLSIAKRAHADSADTVEVVVIDASIKSESDAYRFVTTPIWEAVFPERDKVPLKKRYVKREQSYSKAPEGGAVMGWVFMDEVLALINYLWTHNREEINKCLQTFQK